MPDEGGHMTSKDFEDMQERADMEREDGRYDDVILEEKGTIKWVVWAFVIAMAIIGFILIWTGSKG